MIVLRECPFCGSIAEVRKHGLSPVHCTGCGAVGPALLHEGAREERVAKVVAAWNTRSDDALLKRCDTALETADGLMGGEADNPEAAAWVIEVEQIRGEIKERIT